MTRSPSTPASLKALYTAVADEHQLRADAGTDAAGFDTLELAIGADASVRPPLPGRTARSVVHDEIDEAENLFFTEDGRLFVSGVEDIYEIKRMADGRFSKTDHFHEDCVVEGIVRSGHYLYGVCWTLGSDLVVRSYLLGGELTQDPTFRIIADLDKDVVANGMTVDPEGRVYVTYTTGTGEIVRLTLGEPMQLAGKEVWARGLPFVNGIKYFDGAMYVTLLNEELMGQFARVPLRHDGSAGNSEILYERWFTVLDDVLPFEGGFIISDFLKGTLIFWDEVRGVYAETPSGTFYSPTALAQGQPPMFTDRQLLVAEKGNFLIRGEILGDSLSSYQLP